MNPSRLYQRGTIAGLDGRSAHIVFRPLAGCSGCAGGCGFAQLATLTGAGRCGVLHVDIDPRSDLAVGDTVRVGIRAGRLLQLVFLTFGLPLSGLVTGAVAANALLPAAADIGALSGGVAGLCLAGGVLLARTGRGNSLNWLGAQVTRLT